MNLLRFISTVSSLLLAIAMFGGCGSGHEVVRVTSSPLPRHQQAVVVRGNTPPRDEHLIEHYFLEGSLLEMRGMYGEAIREYQRALRFGSPGPVYYAIAKCFRADGRDDSALAYARRGIAVDSENVDARVQYAELLLENGEVYPALAQFERVIEEEPNNTDVRYTLARLWQRREPERAIMHYEYIRRNLGESFDALLNLSELYLEQHRYNRAIEVMREVLDYGVTTPDIFRLLTDSYMRAGRFDEAISLIDEAATRLAADSLVEIYVVEQLERVNRRLVDLRDPPLGLRNLAHALVTKGMALLPRSSRVELYGGFALMQLDASQRADTLIAHALLDTLTTRDDWTAAARLYMADREYLRGLQVLSPSSLRFDDAEVSYRLGTLHARAGERDEAERQLRHSLTLDDGNAAAWAEMGDLQRDEGNVGAALASYEKAISYDPDNPDYQNACAHLLVENDLHLDRALELSREALRSEPENENYLHTLGWIYYRLNDYDRALQYIQRAVAIGGAGAAVIEHLGDVQRARGDLASAREAYQRALRADPGNRSLLEKLDAVK